MSEQKQLDDASEALGQIIRGIDRLSKAASRRAGQACNDGQMGVSADLRAVEASLRMAAACATEAYAKGRALEIPGAGGGIVAFSGKD